MEKVFLNSSASWSGSWNEYNKRLPQDVDSNNLLISEIGNEIKRTINKNDLKNILEIGCSNGRYLTYLKSLLYIQDLYGIDIYNMKFRKDSFHYCKGNGLFLPFKENSFDIICSFGLLEHFKHQERIKLLKEMVRCVDAEGFLIIDIPNVTSVSLRLIKTKVLDLFREYRHYYINIVELKKDIKSLDCDILSEKFLGTSLHIKNFTVPIHSLFRIRFIMDDYIIIIKKNSVEKI